MDGYITFLNYWKYKEPFVNKLKRWFLGEENLIPPTIIEQRLGDIQLSQASKDILTQLHYKYDAN